MGVRVLPGQLPLPLAAAPLPVRVHGLRAAHVAPLVGRRLGPGKAFWSGRVPASHAWTYPYIVMDDAGATWATITLDCDDRMAMAAGITDLPPTNWLVRTRRGAHLTWCLASPVAKHDAARRAPELLLAHVADYYGEAVSADPGFGGMGRNPSHPAADTIWGRAEPYSLSDLANVVPFGWQRPTVALTGVGRNVDLFRTGLRWAGHKANASLPVLPALHAVNADIAEKHGKPPLPDAEVGSIARSIERYRAKWAARGWHCPRWLSRQAARGRASGRARSEGSNEALRPWEAEGISRATWYRRRASARETRTNTAIAPLGARREEDESDDGCGERDAARGAESCNHDPR